MAKKKTDAAAEQDAISKIFNIVDPSTTETGGVLIPTYSMRWLLDSDIIRFRQVYQFAGEPGSGKSQFGYQIGRLFVLAGGIFEVFDTEGKTSAPATVIPNVGADVYYSGRFAFTPVQHMNKARDKSAEDDGDVGWQALIVERLKAIQKNEKLCNIPIFIFIDSLLGVSIEEAQDKFAKSGVGEGRSTTGMVTAKSLKDYFSSLDAYLKGTKVTIAFSNHQRVEVPTGYVPAGVPPKKTVSGGTFAAHKIPVSLWFRRCGEVKKADVGGRIVHLSVGKNSFGLDNRGLDVAFYVSMEKDAEGNTRRDANDNPIRKIRWDWNEAAAKILVKYCGDDDDASTEACKIIPDLTVSSSGKGKVVSSKTFGVSNLTFSELGREMMRNKELYRAMTGALTLAVNASDPKLAIPVNDPEMSGEQAPDGSWDKSDSSVFEDDTVLAEE